MPLSGSASCSPRENLFDEKYMTAYRYGTLGRSIYGGVRAKF
jgi:vitamin B12 transporter